MTSPLHGENQAFESLRAHRFFFQSEAGIKPEVKHGENEELHNSTEKLCNFGVADNGESLARSMTDRYIDEDGNERIEMLWEEIVPEEGDEGSEWDDASLSDSKQREARKREAIQRANAPQDRKADELLTLGFTRDELDHFTAQRKEGLAEKSRYWIDRSSEALWACTKGVISRETAAKS